MCAAKRHVRFTPNSDIDCVFSDTATLSPCYNDCSSDVAEGPTLAGTIDYAALASALAGVLTLAIMIWIAYAGRS